MKKRDNNVFPKEILVQDAYEAKESKSRDDTWLIIQPEGDCGDVRAAVYELKGFVKIKRTDPVYVREPIKPAEIVRERVKPAKREKK